MTYKIQIREQEKWETIDFEVPEDKVIACFRVLERLVDGEYRAIPNCPTVYKVS